MSMETTFTLAKELRGPTSTPINVILFSEDARFLLSGGDDEKVRVWSTDEYKCIQVLENENWGQIICLTWLYQELPNRERIVALCVGSARGYTTIYPMESRRSKPFARPSRTMPIFEFNDSVEKQSFDKLNCRIAFASHSGVLKLYTVDNCTLKALWTTNISMAIPSAVFFFGGANQSILTLGLENSELCCRDASTSNVLWKKEFIGGSGNAALSSDETTLLVNNLMSGNFDVYNISDDAPLRTLPIGSARRYTKQCQFFEGTKQAVCGSDTNKVYVVDASNNYIVQTLTTGDETNMTQTVGVTPASSRRMFIGGASGGSVYLWERRTSVREPTPPIAEALASLPVASPGILELWAAQVPTVIMLFIFMSAGVWSPYAYKFGSYMVDLYEKTTSAQAAPVVALVAPVVDPVVAQVGPRVGPGVAQIAAGVVPVAAEVDQVPPVVRAARVVRAAPRVVRAAAVVARVTPVGQVNPVVGQAVPVVDRVIYL